MNKSLLLIFVFLYNLSYAQTDTLFCKQLVAVKQLVKDNHYQPKAINDSMSKSVFNLFIKGLDNDKDYFLLSDIKQLQADQLMLDDYLLADNCSFIDKYTTVLTQRVEDSKAILEQLNTKTPDYSGGLTLQYLPLDQYSYPKDYKALEVALEKLVAYKVISVLIDKHQDLKTISANFYTIETSIRLDVIKNQLCLLEELSNSDGGIDRYVKNAFINAYLHYQDPHSTFFNPTEKLIYEGGLSSNQFSFGIITDKNKQGQIIIVDITPGSAAFKNGNFEIDDVIVSLTANDATLKTLCVSNHDIEAFLNKEEHKTVSFLLKKKNGTLQNITITKTKIKVEDNAIRGFLLGTEANLGYIKIPRFYTNDESPNGRGLTSDFAKELYKLQKQNIEGLIIDLRFNGGGSMQEAAELTGMFIDRGPVTIIETKNKESYTIRDNKRGTFFSKPIVVLVNSYSASASEFFASAMQDYNRALIVGSTTHGKSSAQRILPLDVNNNLGFCKITIETFYRVTGQSHQAKGVIPDLKLPSIYDDLDSGEQYYEYALKNDTITAKLKHKPLQKKDYSSIINNNKQRVLANNAFSLISQNNIKLKESLFTKGEKYPLTIENVLKSKQKKKDLINQIFPDQTQVSLIKVFNTKPTEELLNYSKEDQTLNSEIITQLSKDIYIAESYNILKDLIHLNSN